MMETGQSIDSTDNRFASVGALTAAHLELQEEHSKNPDGAEMVAKIEAFLKNGTETGSLLDHPDDRQVCQSLLDYWVTMLYSAGVEGVQGALQDFDPDKAPMLPDEPCPYLGLGEFQEQDAGKFFGRKHLVEQMVEQLATMRERMLLVVGPSGSGKSSAVKAGLLPALKDDAIEGSSSWFYHNAIVPGDSPNRNLQRCLDVEGAGGRVQVFLIDQFEELFTLCRDTDKREAFAKSLAGLSDEGHAIVLTLRSDFEPYLDKLSDLQGRLENSRVAVNSLSAPDLRTAIEAPAKSVGLKFEKGVVERLVEDLVGEPAGLPLLQFTLMKLWENRQRNRITMEAYKKLGGGRLALARSADAIYDEFIPEECTTAKRLFLRLVQPGEGLEVTRKRVPVEDLYRAGEAQDRVERVLESFISARLIRKIESDGDQPAKLEVIHEALVRNWPKLTEWLDSARNRLRQNAKLTTAAEDWQRQGQKEEFLFRGDQLAEVELSSRGFEEELGPDEQAFLKASRKLRDAEARKAERGKLIMLGLIGAGISMIAITILAVKAYSNFLEARSSLEMAEAAKEDAKTQRDLAEIQWGIAKEQKKIAEEALYLRGKNYIQNARFNKNQSNYFASAMMGAVGLGFRGFDFSGEVEGGARYPELIPEEKDGQLHRELEGLVGGNLRTGFPIWQSPTTNHHLATVTGVACSPDPDRPWLVSCSPDKTIKLWDIVDGRELTVSAGNESDLLCVAFGDDGRIASGDAAGTIRLWTLEADEDGTVAFVRPEPLTDHTSAVLSLSFLENNTLESRSADTIKRWDLDQLKAIESIPAEGKGGGAGGVSALSTDRQQRAEGDPKTGEIAISDATSGAVRLEMLHPGGVASLAFSADGKLLVSGGSDRKIRLWKLDTGDPFGAVPSDGHRGGISKLVFHPDGRLASLSSDLSVHVWSANDGRNITESVSAGQRVRSFAWGNDAESGEEVRLYGDDLGQVRLWDPTTKQWHVMADVPESVEIGSVPPAAVAEEGNPPEPVTLLELSPDGRLAVSYGGDRRIKLWSVAGKSRESQSQALNMAVLSLKFSAEGMLIISSGEDQSVRLWDVTELNDKPLLELTNRSGHPIAGRVRSVAVSPRGRLFATATGKSVKLWDLTELAAGATTPTHAAASAQMEHNAEVTAIAFRSDGEVLASSAADGSVKLWRIGEESTTLITALSAHQTGVHTMAFSPGGDRLAAGSLDDSSLKVWYVGEGESPAPARDLVAYLRDGWCEFEGRNIVFQPVTNPNLFGARKFETTNVPPPSSPPAADSLPVNIVEADSVRALRERGQLPILTKRTGMLMIWVPTIDGWVGETEVTRRQFVRGGGARPTNIDGLDRPVENMTYQQAKEFCEKVMASEKEIGHLPDGYVYSLPTEKQWLAYVADAGLDHAVYGQRKTAEVKSKPANAHKLYDVRGNVWELTTTRHPSEPGLILRGGCFKSEKDAILGSEYRGCLKDGDEFERYGFRCVLVKESD